MVEKIEEEEGAFAPENSLDTLDMHANEAARQMDQLTETTFEWNQWDLMVAFLGRLDDCSGRKLFKHSRLPWSVGGC